MVLCSGHSFAMEERVGISSVFVYSSGVLSRRRLGLWSIVILAHKANGNHTIIK